MKLKDLLKNVWGIGLTLLLLFGCSPQPTLIPSPIPPTSTPIQHTSTPIPIATSTNTPIPSTPTIAAIPGSKEPIVIGDFNLKISTVDLNDKGLNGMVPYAMTADQTVLVVEVSLISGDLGNLSYLEVWVTDEQGNQTNTPDTLEVPTKNQVIWLFAVAKTGHLFFLHFPSGEVIDLSPLLP